MTRGFLIVLDGPLHSFRYFVRDGASAHLELCLESFASPSVDEQHLLFRVTHHSLLQHLVVDFNRCEVFRLKLHKHLVDPTARLRHRLLYLRPFRLNGFVITVAAIGVSEFIRSKHN